LTKSNEINEIQTHWISESGVIDVFLMFGPTAHDVFKQYAELTGATPLPPVSEVNSTDLFYFF
jgi:alpha 1,3-glucosidase